MEVADSLKVGWIRCCRNKNYVRRHSKRNLRFSKGIAKVVAKKSIAEISSKGKT